MTHICTRVHHSCVHLSLSLSLPPWQVAYHGIPAKAHEVFLEAYLSSSVLRGHHRFQLTDSKNPADVIMDMLGSEDARAAVLAYYQNTSEPAAVLNAINDYQASTGKCGVGVTAQWYGCSCKTRSFWGLF